MSRALRRTSTTTLLAAGLASVVLTTTVPATAAETPAPRSTAVQADQGTITPFSPTVPNPTTATRAQLNAAASAGQKKPSPFLAPPQGAAASDVAGQISRSEVIARAKTWVDAGVPYSMTNYRTDANGRYRTDCSGFVSMAWHLSSSSANNWGETTGTLLEFTSSISKESLKPGDILLNPDPGADGHVVIFNGWTNAEHTRYDAYEQAGRVGAVHREIPYPYWSGHGTFSPRRYDKIIDGAPADTDRPARTVGGDFDGDGKQDIAGIDASNNMKLYTGDNAGHVTGGSSMLGDNGLWANFKSIAAGDFNADGKQDIAGIDASNNLKLYTGDGAGHVSGGTDMLGSTGWWAGFKGITAGDFNGDGKQDIAGIDAGNNLKLYTGDGAGHLAGGTDMLGSTGWWAGFKGITAGDFNNDGKQDIAGIDASNNLKLHEALHRRQRRPRHRRHRHARQHRLVGGLLERRPNSFPPLCLPP
ncbi:FG-GAP-like repeat-containing protein [Streptomyces sp. NRRL S-241]|uniref:C40 family peptidase n=1 Tax=Streptomyces sp. NRRL S-241 TaxID=1463896 RepID=UPI0006895A52|nr:FG-GAP-like repeat-containing protein [Streptomyces sp. NRRL S-241]